MDVSPVTRTIPFSTVFNFRDVGGYLGLDGRRVRWRRLYRSDSLHRLADSDAEAFAALGVRTVVDLRRPREVEYNGRVPAYEGLVYRHIHPEHREWDDIPYDEQLGFAHWLAERYVELTDSGAAGIAEAIGIIAEEDSAPLVVHCAAGKDRTGVVCGLTLALLGVDDSDIAADYTLSTAWSDRFAAWWHERRTDAMPIPAHYVAAPAEAMHLFLDRLRERHGSVEGYLRDAGLTAAHFDSLRAHLLDRA